MCFVYSMTLRDTLCFKPALQQKTFSCAIYYCCCHCYHFDSLQVFHTSISCWSFTGVRVIGSLFRSPGLLLLLLLLLLLYFWLLTILQQVFTQELG